MAMARVESDQIGVLVVDDHPIFRLGVSERIKSIGGRVALLGEGGNGFEAHTLAGALSPHVILMDLNMPGMTGIEATRNIKKDYPEIHIIILSADDEINDINDALQAGAGGYLLKSVSGIELQEAIFSVMEGGSVLSPTVTRRLFAELTRPTVVANKLSEREIQILTLVSTGATNGNIAKDLFLSVRTIEAHVHKIFQKLGVASRTEAVTQAIRENIIKN